MNQLTNQLLSCVQATDKTIPWYDQRSAMGLARTWIGKRDFKRSEYHPVTMKRRDDLAEEVIALLAADGRGNDELISTMIEARAIMDAPFQDEKMLGYRAAKAKRGQIGRLTGERKEKK